MAKTSACLFEPMLRKKELNITRHIDLECDIFGEVLMSKLTINHNHVGVHVCNAASIEEWMFICRGLSIFCVVCIGVRACQNSAPLHIFIWHLLCLTAFFIQKKKTENI